MSNVVTHSRFQLDKIDADTLKGMGVEVLTDFPSDAELGIPGIKAGEIVLGTLTEEEFSIFVEMVELTSEIEGIQKAITARKLHEAAEKLVMQEGNLFEAASETVGDALGNLFQDEDEEMQFFTATAKLNLLRSTFYWVMGEKHNCHNYRTGVRTNRRFVRLAKRAVNG